PLAEGKLVLSLSETQRMRTHDTFRGFLDTLADSALWKAEAGPAQALQHLEGLHPTYCPVYLMNSGSASSLTDRTLPSAIRKFTSLPPGLPKPARLRLIPRDRSRQFAG